MLHPYRKGAGFVIQRSVVQFLVLCDSWTRLLRPTVICLSPLIWYKYCCWSLAVILVIAVYLTRKADQFVFLFWDTLKCVKIHLTKFSERESKRIKMCCINMHLTSNPFTLNKYCIYKLLCMIVTCCQNKVLNNEMFFCTKFMDLLNISWKH